MTELREGTMKITITEAALKVLAGPRFDRWWQDEFGLGQCDKCLVFVTREKVGYRDESRVECKECHQHDWRCNEDFGEDSYPHEHQGVPEWEEVRGRMRTDFCRCGARRFSNAFYAWPWETSADGQRDTDTTRKV